MGLDKRDTLKENGKKYCSRAEISQLLNLVWIVDMLRGIGLFPNCYMLCSAKTENNVRGTASTDELLEQNHLGRGGI